MEQTVTVVSTLVHVVVGVLVAAGLILAALGAYALVAMVRTMRSWPF
jgi:hypothetical protein